MTHTLSKTIFKSLLNGTKNDKARKLECISSLRKLSVYALVSVGFLLPKNVVLLNIAVLSIVVAVAIFFSIYDKRRFTNANTINIEINFLSTILVKID